MQITRNSVDTAAGPGDWFTGNVYGLHRDTVGHVACEREQRPLHARARTGWHTHANGQTIYVIEGVGLAQRRGRPIDVIRPGDRVFFEPGEDHWHGASPNRFMTHIAIVQVDDEGNTATWADHVTDEEYGAATTT